MHRVKGNAASNPWADYNPELGPTRNGLYGVSSAEASFSDVHVMKDEQAVPRFEHDEVYLDDVVPLGAGYAKTPLMGLLFGEFHKRGGLGSALGRGFESCQWLRRCSEHGEYVGSTCSATLSGVLYRGFCFPSDTGTLECGRLTGLNVAAGTRPFAFDSRRHPTVVPSGGAANATLIASSPGAGPSFRCSILGKAKGFGTYVGSRLPIAGCMISSDANYSLIADVHVPAYCATVLDYRPGCLVPAAVNYDPSALQSSTCHYYSLGCTDSSAVNFNSEAFFSDGSCILRRTGCTVAAAFYAGITSGTPVPLAQAPSRMPGRTVGTAGFVGMVAVLNPSTTANVNEGCIIAIEGCMDSSAINYEPRANVQATTICLPRVQGCMMPTLAGAGPSAPLQFGGQRDGLAVTYNAAATMHDRSACSVARYGCTNPQAINYDPVATVNRGCYLPKFGCLNRLALNYGCDTRDSLRCNVSLTMVTVHNPFRCIYPGEAAANTPSPPSPPPPRAPDGVRGLVATVRYAVSTTTTVQARALDLASSKSAILGAFNGAFPIGAGQPQRELTIIDAFGIQYRRRLQVAQETSTLRFSQTYDSPAAAASAQAEMRAADLSVGNLQAVFASVPGVQIVVLSSGSVSTEEILTYEPPPVQSGLELYLWYIIGGAAGGGVFFLGCCCALAVICAKRRRLRVVDASVVTPTKPTMQPVKDVKEAWSDEDSDPSKVRSIE